MQQQWSPEAEILPVANYLGFTWAESMDMWPWGPDTVLLCELQQISLEFKNLGAPGWLS